MLKTKMSLAANVFDKFVDGHGANHLQRMTSKQLFDRVASIEQLIGTPLIVLSHEIVDPHRAIYGLGDISWCDWVIRWVFAKRSLLPNV